MKQKPKEYMTTAHLNEQMESIIVRHNKDLNKIEAKQELVVLAKEWMNRSEVQAIDEKFNVWNSELASLVQKHDIRRAKT